nr:hypothetical protein [Tanacetum cinerariifolium]
ELPGDDEATVGKRARKLVDAVEGRYKKGVKFRLIADTFPVVWCNLRLFPPRVNAANPSAVSAARVNTVNPSAVSAARVKAARLFAVSVARINAVKPSAVTAVQHNHTKKGNPQQALKDKGVIDSGCSRHMTGNISYLSDFEELNGGFLLLVVILKVMCDKKNIILFTDTGCLVLSSDFKLPDASQVLLRVPRENNMYNVNLKNIIPSGDLTCLFAKATLDESNLCHRRLGHEV